MQPDFNHLSRELADLAHKQAAKSPAWQRAAGKNEEGGLNAKGRASYNKATGGNLKAPVTESNPKGDRAKRQNSFCARMCGMKRVNTGGKTKKDPDSRINKSLRKWNCKCGSEEEKQAAALPGLIGAFAGAAGGGLTGKKNKVNRAIGRGALIGAATELGMYPGMALGTIPGFLLGNALAGPGGGVPGAVIGGSLGTAAGGMLGNAAAKGLLGPYETPEELEEEKETKEEKKMANAFEFGVKIATTPQVPSAQPTKLPWRPRPSHVVPPVDRPHFKTDNIFEQVALDDARRAARPLTEQALQAKQQADYKFKKTWNPSHLGSSLYNSALAFSRGDGEVAYNTSTNNPQELALQNTEYDIAESEYARQQKARQEAHAQQRKNPGFVARLFGAKPEPNIFEELEQEPPVGNSAPNMANMFKGSSALEFGRKLAEVTTCSAPKHNEQSGVDVNPVAAGTPEGKEKLTKKKLPLKAEDVVTSKAAEFGRKLAQSLVNFVERKPKDLAKGTLNPTAAGEYEEEVKEEPADEEDDGLIV